MSLLLLVLYFMLKHSPVLANEKWIGKCEPLEAVKILEAELAKGKSMEQAFEAVVKGRKIDGSKACFTFIRETSMENMDAYPKTFQSLWVNGGNPYN